VSLLHCFRHFFVFSTKHLSVLALKLRSLGEMSESGEPVLQNNNNKTTDDTNDALKESPKSLHKNDTLKRTANEFSEDSNSVLESTETDSASKKQKTRENGNEDNNESNDANEAEAGNDVDDEEEDEEDDVVPEDYADDDDDDEAANDDEEDDEDDQ